VWEIAFRPVDKAQANTSNNEPKPEELLKKKSHADIRAFSATLVKQRRFGQLKVLEARYKKFFSIVIRYCSLQYSNVALVLACTSEEHINIAFK
jgi:hypothetical protein